MSLGTVTLITGVLCAIACALPGSFLVLRRMSMMSDAISHAILPGLVLGYWLAEGPSILWGGIGALLAALVTVTLVQVLESSRLIGSAEAMGMIFPAMFALGTIVISRAYSNVHLDTDAVLFGNIEFAGFDRFVVTGRDLGPTSLWIMGTLIVLNCAFLAVFAKELRITTFDADFARALGFSPLLVHGGLMVMLAMTTVGAFTAVGAILVVALIVVPAATAWLLTNRLSTMIWLSVLIGAVSAFAGYWLAVAIDGSVSGAIVTVAGVIFLAAFLFSPLEGQVTQLLRVKAQRERFADDVLLLHIQTHEHTDRAHAENSIVHMSTMLRRSPDDVQTSVARLERAGMLAQDDDAYVLTARGRTRIASVHDRNAGVRPQNRRSENLIAAEH